MVPAPSGNRGAPTKKRKLQTNDYVKSAEFDSPFLADSLNFKPEFLTNMIDLDLGTSAVSFRICYWNNMESQFLSPVGVPPHLRSEGIYRVHTSVYMKKAAFTILLLIAWLHSNGASNSSVVPPSLFIKIMWKHPTVILFLWKWLKKNSLYLFLPVSNSLTKWYVTRFIGSCFTCLEPRSNRSQHKTNGVLVHSNSSMNQLLLYDVITLAANMHQWCLTKSFDIGA